MYFHPAGTSMSSRATQFSNLYENHHRRVLAYCLRRTNETDANDAASEVFAIAWRRIDDLPNPDMELAWLYAVARRVLSRQWRGARRLARLRDRVQTQPQHASPDPATAVAQSFEDSLVLAAAKTLNALDREVLRLAAWEGLTHREIAGILGIKVAAVDQRFHRAKKRLATAYLALTGAESSATSEGSA